MNTAFSLDHFLANLPPVIDIDLETTGVERWSEVFSIGLAWSYDGGQSYNSASFYVSRLTPGNEANDAIVQKILAVTLFNSDWSGEVIFHNMAFDLPMLVRRYLHLIRGLSHLGDSSDLSLVRLRRSMFCGLQDSMVLSRVQRNNKFKSHADPKMERCHSLKYLVRDFFGGEHHSFEDVVGQGSIEHAPLDEVLEYNRKDAEWGLRIYFALLQRLSSPEIQYYRDIEMPFTFGLVCLNWQGLPFDMLRATGMSRRVHGELSRLEEQIIRVTKKPTLKLRGPELGRHLYNNSHLTYIKDGIKRRLRRESETDTGLPKLDGETLAYQRQKIVKIDPKSNVPEVLKWVIQYLELSKAYSDLESLTTKAVQVSRSSRRYRIYPYISAQALTGRINCGNPNALGLSKHLFDSELIKLDKSCSSDQQLLALEKEFPSLRNLIRVDCEKEATLLSVDITALDIGVIAHFIGTEQWRQLFEKHACLTIDVHMGLLKLMSEERYMKALLPFLPALGLKIEQKNDLLNYWVTKKDAQNKIHFIHDKSDVSIPTSPTKDQLLNLNEQRNPIKTLNLAVPYNLGVDNFSLKLSKATGRLVSIDEAQDELDRYFEKFPEVRRVQDELANSVYRDGFVAAPFGRKFYANTWDELNDHRNLSRSGALEEKYEFITFKNNAYWYIEASDWYRHPGPVVERQRRSAEALEFSRIKTAIKLPSSIFRKKPRNSKSKFQKKSENRQEEQSEFLLDNFSITSEIETAVPRGLPWTREVHALFERRHGNTVSRYNKERGTFRIPGKICFYRTQTLNPSSRYFHPFDKFLSTAKKMFPQYCQAVAAIVAKIIYVKIQTELERQNLEAHILMFIHDQYVVQCRNEATTKEQVSKIINDAIASSKPNFSIRHSGEAKEESPYFQ